MWPGLKLGCVWLLALVALLVAPARPLRADQDDMPSSSAADWQWSGVDGPVRRLFAPSSGALFAQTSDGLMRSDDAGASWRPVQLPPINPGKAACGRFAVVDPTDHTIIFAFDPAGLFKTSDDAQTWTQLALPDQPIPSLPQLNEKSLGVSDLAVSPADHRVLYLTLTNGGDPSIAVDLRSDDGGASWRTLGTFRGSSYGSLDCGSFEPHPTDVTRVFAIRTGGHGGNLEESTDRGESFQTIRFLVNGVRHGGTGWTPAALVGGNGTAPARLYAVQLSETAPQQAELLRSDDDGSSWRELLQARLVDGLAYDPVNPDHVYVGLHVDAPDPTIADAAANEPHPTVEQVQASLDGGETWQALGQQDIGQVHDLALGIDGQNLYAATDTGLWRIAVPPRSEDQPNIGLSMSERRSD